LIINAGDGYYLLLAGMDQISVETGQFVLAGEPVGTWAKRHRSLRPSAPLREVVPPSM
jgi:septal ring factor EnvC (AmiA/AmiB activator)